MQHMADHLVLSWGIDELAVATVRVEGGRASVVKSLRQAWDDGLQSFTVAEAATQIRKWLDEAGIGREAATVVLPRESVILRKLDLPDAPDDELPDLVRFQAATKASTPIDELALDYLPLPADAATVGRAAIAVTMDRQKLARIEAVLRGAGLNVSRVTLSTIAAVRFIQWSHLRGAQLPSPALLLYQRAARIEMSVFDAGNLVFSHGVRLPEGDASKHVQPLRTEINRSTVALSQIHHNATIEHCFLLTAGAPDDDVVSFLSERFSGHLTTLSGAQVDRSVEGFESLVGAVVQTSLPLPDVDLLHPRKKAEKPDRRRLYWTVGGGIAAASLVLGYLMLQWQIGQYNDRIEELQQESSRLTQLLDKGKPRREFHDVLAARLSADADIHEVWTTLSQLMPGTETLYLANVKVEPKNGVFLARVSGTIRARTPDDISRFLQELADAGHSPEPPRPDDKVEDPDYPAESQLVVNLRRPAPSAAKPAAPVPAS